MSGGQMPHDIVFSPHAERRVKERLKISTGDVKERLAEKVYAEAGALKHSHEVVKKYLVLWDRVLGQPVLLILEEWEACVVVVTVYPTEVGHESKEGVVVEARHIAEAQNREYYFWQLRQGATHHAVRTLFQICFLQGSKPIRRKVKLPHIPYADFKSRYGSFRNYLLAAVEEGLFKDIWVPTYSDIEAVLYCYLGPGDRVELEKLVVQAESCNIPVR